jgi:hypothetical protein
MLAEQQQAASPPNRRALASQRAGRARRVASLLAFTGAVALVLLYALRGGAYDTVVFEEYGIVVWWIIAIGVGLGVLPRSRPHLAVLLLIGAAIAYVGWTALSLLWTESAERTMTEVARSLDYLGLIALVGLAVDRQTWRAAAAGLAAGALLVCLLALASRLAPSAFPRNYVGSAFDTDRLSYPLGYWNALGAWGAMSIAIGLAWSVHDPSRVRRATALALVPVAAAVTYLTYSRAGVAGAALAAVLVIAVSSNRLTAVAHTLVAAAGSALVVLAIHGHRAIARGTGTHGAGTVAALVLAAAAICAAAAWLTSAVHADAQRVPRRLARPLLIVGLVVVLGAAGAFGPRLVSHAWHSFKQPVVTQTADPATRLMNLGGSRYPVWKVAYHAFAHDPLTGTGAGTFAFWWNRHATDYEFLHDAHNIWLQNMAELGAPGLLAIVALALGAIAVAILARRRARRAISIGPSVGFLAAFIVFLLSATFDWMWESTAVTALAICGVTAIGGRLSVRTGRLRLPLRAVLVVVALAATAIQIPSLLSTLDIRRSQAAAKSGNLSLALAWANDAVSAEPWAASPYEQRGLVYEVADRLPQAADDLNRAISHETTNYVHWLILSRIQTERDKPVAALADYRRARSLRPYAQVLQYAPYFKTK